MINSVIPTDIFVNWVFADLNWEFDTYLCMKITCNTTWNPTKHVNLHQPALENTPGLDFTFAQEKLLQKLTDL